MKSSSRSGFRRFLIIAVVLLVALPGGYFGARHYALPAYRNWRETKLARMARAFMAEGDYDNALLTARQVLRKNQRSIEHWRLAAAAAKGKGTAEVIYYQKNVARLDHSLASQLELIREALKFGDYRDAIDAIEAINPEAKQNAEFHALAAQTYLAVGRPITAKLNLYSLVSLRPDDNAARLDLAQIEISEDPEGKNRKLRDDVMALSRVPELRVRALEMLERDAIARDDRTRALEVAELLRHTPNLTGEQRVLILAGLTQSGSDRADDYRHELETAFVGDAAGAVALADYFRKAGPRVEARKWFDSLTEEVRANPKVQEAIAAAFLEWNEWARLDQILANSHWKQREFMRHAFTAYSARKNGRVAEAGSSWRLAVIQAGDSVKSTSELLALVARWGWQTEQYDLVWKLFALMPRNETISRQLLAWERSQGHTANLNRIFARLVEFSADDPMIRNNFAYSSLLLDANLSKAYEFARMNYEAAPDNPYYVTTQAFALYKQNKPAEALALLETLRPVALSVPERVMFRAVFRAAIGDASGAADLLTGLKSAGFLPEERRLVTQTVSDIARLKGQKGQDQLLLALNSRGEIDRSKGWLHALPEKVRANATVEMQTSDSLLAMGDLTAFMTELHKGTWGEHEHLRLALTAYAARRRDDITSSSSYWRTALGSAAGDPKKLQDLEALATAWGWRSEQIGVLARLYDTDPANQSVFTELIDFYRRAGRTGELVSVLNSYLSAHPDDQAQRCYLAYYSMLSGIDLARAYVTAQEAYQSAPTDVEKRLVYAFALWKQRRAREAWDLLEEVGKEKSPIVPVLLLRAAVLADLDRKEEALQALKTFEPKNALPEETNLAAILKSRLKNDSRVTQVN